MLKPDPAPRCRARGNGYTLIELLISIGLLAIGVSSAVGLTRWVTRAVDINRNVSRATFLAQDKMENLLQLGYVSATSGGDTTQGVTRAWTVASAAAATYKTITVTATVKGIDGVPRSVVLSSILAEP